MNHQAIPEHIIIAASAMLAPYIPNLTPDRIQNRLAFEQEPEPTERLLTKKEAAAAPSISTDTLDRMIVDGQLDRRKIRGAVRIPQSAVDAIINGEIR